jgi:hypothetical protein
VDQSPSSGETPVSQVKIPTPRPSRLLSAGYFKGAELLDLSQVDLNGSYDSGFSHPDWKSIREAIKTNFPKDQWPQAWREIGIKWLAQLQEDLGGDYRQHESWNFLLLSSQTKSDNEAMLNISECANETIEAHLAFSVPLRPLYGKRVILAFDEQDDYYDYLSHFYQDGHHSLSAGVFLSDGYMHVAMPFSSISLIRQVLIHELTHNSLAGLRLPTWLNEGLSKRLERKLSWMMDGGRRSESVILDRELAQEHDAWWNEENIQGFWAGTSFYRPDEGNKLSYNLGEILVELLSNKWDAFLDFVQNADPRDAGQDAALKCLNCCLGETLGGFLGPGKWRPDRKAIAELWEQRRPEPGNQAYFSTGFPAFVHALNPPVRL